MKNHDDNHTILALVTAHLATRPEKLNCLATNNLRNGAKKMGVSASVVIAATFGVPQPPVVERITLQASCTSQIDNADTKTATPATAPPYIWAAGEVL